MTLFSPSNYYNYMFYFFDCPPSLSVIVLDSISVTNYILIRVTLIEGGVYVKKYGAFLKMHLKRQ